MTYRRYNFRQIKRTAIALLMIAAIVVLLFTAFCPSAGAVGLVDDTVDAAHEYSRYPLGNYQLDFYVDNGWDWLPWNWIDGIGKQVMYGLYCITNFIWTINLYLSNASGYLVQEAYGLDFVSSAADEIGRNIQSIAGISPSGLSSDGFYAGFLLLIILIVGAYVAYVGLIKRETTKAVRAVMNMVLIFVLSGALIAYAPDCVKRLNEFSEDVSTASLSVGTKIVLPDVENSGGDSVALIRDSLFSIQVKQPWLLLQFGDTDTDTIGADRIESLLSASPSGNNGEDRENAVKAEIEDNGNTNLTVTKTVNRLGTVFFLFLFNIGISVFVFLLTGMMIFSQVLFIIYAMFLPVSFVLSMVPTFEGSSRRAVIKLFNTILARAGITLIITVAFSISTMLYRISSGYPFFIIAFLQVVVFAGTYFKLGDLLSMFSLHDDGARGMGRYILHRPRMFLHHQIHTLNRTMRAASASRPNGGTGSGSNRSNSGTGAGRSPRGSSAGGWYRSGPYGGSGTGGGAGNPSPSGMNTIPGAAVPGLYGGSLGAGPRGNTPGATPSTPGSSANGVVSGNHSGNASGGIVPALPPGNTVARHAPSGSMSPSSAGRHIRPVILIAPSGQQVSSAKPAQAMSKLLLPPPQHRPVAVDTTKTASASVTAANRPAPHERPTAAPQADLAAKQTEPPAQKRHEAASTVHGRQDMVRQDNKARPVRDSTVEHPVQDKPDMSRPAVRDSTPKRALVKGNGTRRSKRKYTSAPKSTGKRGNSAESKKERGGSK